jgi:hypothetical protein
VTDGIIGFTAMDYGAYEGDGTSGSRDGEIWLHRSWFMLGDVVVVLGVGNVTSASSVYPVTTSLDQRLLDGVVSYSVGGDVADLPFGARETVNGLQWVHHGTIAYAMLPDRAATSIDDVVLSAVAQNGSWFDITQGDQALIKHDVFTAFINHGVLGIGGRVSHAYLILPGVTAATAVPAAVSSAVHGLTVQNDWDAQYACSIRDSGSVVLMASMWYRSSAIAARAVGCWDVTLVAGIEDQGAMLMLQRDVGPNSALQISASNPHAIGGTLVFTISQHYEGTACIPGPNNTTTVTLTVPANIRGNGQGTSGKTVSASCAPTRTLVRV